VSRQVGPPYSTPKAFVARNCKGQLSLRNERELFTGQLILFSYALELPCRQGGLLLKSNDSESDTIPEAAPALGFQTELCELAQRIVKAQSDWGVAARSIALEEMIAMM